MGIDYLTCNNCGDAFPDVIDYIYCEGCGHEWCSDDCAAEDGYERQHCKLGKDIEYDDPRPEEECEFTTEEGYCDNCDNFVIESCKYCRGEDFEDGELLEYALKLMELKRYELIASYKYDKNKKKV